MSDEPAAFKATFHNFKIILGRGVVQWIFETPMEQLPLILEVTGAPKPGEEAWFGIARLTDEAG